MHELPATRGILDVALAAAAEAGAGRVLAIHVVVGEVASIMDDSVQFYFDLLSRDTPAQGAALRFRRVPGTARCGDCAHAFPVRPPLERSCPRCGSLALVVSGGQELYVESIDVADEEPASASSAASAGTGREE
jgi:hydrogenase nickel incorporation protein HypA/HybF